MGEDGGSERRLVGKYQWRLEGMIGFWTGSVRWLFFSFTVPACSTSVQSRIWWMRLSADRRPNGSSCRGVGAIWAGAETGQPRDGEGRDGEGGIQSGESLPVPRASVFLMTSNSCAATGTSIRGRASLLSLKSTLQGRSPHHSWHAWGKVGNMNDIESTSKATSCGRVWPL